MRDRNTVEAELRRIIAAELPDKPDPASLRDDVPVFRNGLGLDSMSGLTILTAIEERFSVYIGDDEFDIFDSLKQLVDYVYANSNR